MTRTTKRVIVAIIWLLLHLNGAILGMSTSHTSSTASKIIESKEKLTDSKICKGHIGPIKSIAIIKNKIIVSGSEDKTMRIWDVSGVENAVCVGHEDVVLAITASIDDTFYSGSADQTMRKWNLEGTQLMIFKGHTDTVFVVRAKKRVLASGSGDATVRIWDADRNEHVTCLGHTAGIKHLEITSDKIIISGADDKTIRMWNKNGRQLALFQGHNGPIGHLVLVKNGIVSSEVPTNPEVKSWSTILLWDKNGKLNKKLKVETAKMVSLCAREETFVSGGDTIKVWNSSGEELATHYPHQGTVSILYLTHDYTILSAGIDGIIRVWSGLSGGREIGQFCGHEMPIEVIQGTKNDEYIISGSRDGTIRIWNLKKFLESWRREQCKIDFSESDSDSSLSNHENN